MMLNTMLLTDLDILHFFNGSNNILIDQLALVLTSGLTWIPLYLTLFYIVIRNNETMAQIALAVMGALVCVALTEAITDGIVKPLVARWRPNNDPVLKYTIQVVGSLRGKGYSFFSAHAANTMVIAVFFSLLIRSKRLAVALVAWSLINCWTRLYLGMHYPSDILCGQLLGTVIAVVGYLLYLRLYYRVSPRITYVSNQYTRTGYDHDDIDIVLCILAFTFVYAVLKALIMTCYI